MANAKVSGQLAPNLTIIFSCNEIDSWIPCVKLEDLVTSRVDFN